MPAFVVRSIEKEDWSPDSLCEIALGTSVICRTPLAAESQVEAIDAFITTYGRHAVPISIMSDALIEQMIDLVDAEELGPADQACVTMGIPKKDVLTIEQVIERALKNNGFMACVIDVNDVMEALVIAAKEYPDYLFVGGFTRQDLVSDMTFLDAFLAGQHSLVKKEQGVESLLDAIFKGKAHGRDRR